MHIDWWTVALQAINVLILIWLLGRFLFDPVATLIEERRNKASAILTDAQAMRDAAVQERKAAEDQRAEIARSREELLAKAAEEAETLRRAMLERARVEAASLRDAEQEKAKRQAHIDEALLAARATQLAARIAARLLTRVPDQARVSPFLEGLERSILDLPATARASLISGQSPLRIVAPRALGADEEAALRAALIRSLGPGAAFTVAVDPDVLAGLEAQSEHVTIRNSFRADLERIVHELEAHEPVV